MTKMFPIKPRELTITGTTKCAISKKILPNVYSKAANFLMLAELLFRTSRSYRIEVVFVLIVVYKTNGSYRTSLENYFELDEK